MVDKLKKKLNSRAGESIGETLVALLIAAVALVMLAGAISASSDVVISSRKKLEKYYEGEEKLADLSGTASSGTITITDATGAISFTPYNVVFYQNKEFQRTPVVEYKISE